MAEDSPSTPPLPALPPKIAGAGVQVSIRATAADCAPTDGYVRVLEWDDSERTVRAMIRLGVFWALAVVSIAVPFLHFCLVPLLFVAGPFAAWLAYRQKSVVLGGVATCPKCRKPVRVEKGPDEWPGQAQCAGCEAWLSLERADEAGPSA